MRTGPHLFVINVFLISCSIVHPFHIFYYSKAGLLRVGPVPASNSPTIQRSTKPTTLPQKAQPAQALQSVKPAAPERSKMVIGGGGRYEEDPCVICHEDMNASSDIVTLECGHRYHSPVRCLLISLENQPCLFSKREGYGIP